MQTIFTHHLTITELDQVTGGNFAPNLYKAADGNFYDLNNHAPSWVQSEAGTARSFGTARPALFGPKFTLDPGVERADFRNAGGHYTYGWTG
jgi:hypothetical protein